MKKYFFILLIFAFGCSPQPKTEIPAWNAYDETNEIAENANHPTKKLRYKLIQSRLLDKNDIWKNIEPQIANFSEEDYQNLKGLILDQDIPSMQSRVQSGELSYEKITQWYLYRIAKFENDRDSYLNAIISINPEAVALAREMDKSRSTMDHPIYGMPVLLKDNIGFEGLATTAGTHVLKDNQADDAFIVKQIKSNGGIILGKTNLSEWANFLCFNCPNGYSAMGGQTLNAYGRKLFDTGGSSSGSGVAMAANYAAAAVGTETSGSILSPSSKSSLVGLKPTVGLLSRAGIVPLSSTLDTPGPMTRFVIDNAILLSAMSGEDAADQTTKNNPKNKKYWEDLQAGTFDGMRFGANQNYLKDSLYKLTIDKLEALGAEVIVFDPVELNFDGFGDLLSADMRKDLPEYIKSYASENIEVQNMDDVVAYNLLDTTIRIPYGQGRFAACLDVELNLSEIDDLDARLELEGRRFFETPMQEFQLDAILSIDNRGAGIAAAAKYPCLILPMGYRTNGQPTGITFIARTFEEDKLLKIGYIFEKENSIRVSPSNFK
jgi:amidase